MDQKMVYDKKIRPIKDKIIETERKRQKREEDEVHEAERSHKEEIAKLQQADPIYDGDTDEEDNVSFEDAINDDELEDQLEEAQEQESDEEPEDGVPSKQELTLSDMAGLLQQLDPSPSIRSLKRAIHAFRTAANQGYLGVGDSQKTEDKSFIKDTEVFELIVTVGAERIPAALNAFIGRSKGSKKPHQYEKWSNVKQMAKGYASSVAKLITSAGLPDAIIAHVLRHSVKIVDFLYIHIAIARSLLNACLHHVANTNEKIQIVAFLVVREMATPGNLPPPFTDICMRGMYLTFVKNTRSFNHETHSTVSYVMNECVELFGVDLASAYQHMFIYIRQLAVYLKTALQSGAGEEAFRHVYNWQYINSLRLWAMTASRYNDEKELLPLVYPLCQVACGVVELFPSPKTFPLHLIVISILNHLSKAAGVYIPVAGYILRILSSPEFAKNYRKQESSSRPHDLMFILRAKKADFSSFPYQSSVWNEALYLLSEHLALQSHTIGFPELVYPLTARLKKLSKELSNNKWRQSVTSLLQKIKSASDFIVKKRKAVTFGPSAVDKVC